MLEQCRIYLVRTVGFPLLQTRATWTSPGCLLPYSDVKSMLPGSIKFLQVSVLLNVSKPAMPMLTASDDVTWRQGYICEAAAL